MQKVLKWYTLIFAFADGVWGEFFFAESKCGSEWQIVCCIYPPDFSLTQPIS